MSVAPEEPKRVLFAAEPLVLIGTPRQCVGALRARNPHEVEVWPGRARLRATHAQLRRASERGALEILLYGTLPAGEEQQLRVALRLPPGTPPGTYQASIEGAEGPTPVTIHVLEQRMMQLAPGSLTLSAAPGASVIVRTAAQNLGNVPLTIPAHTAVALHPTEHSWTDHFHAAAKAHGDEGYEKFLDAFVKRMGAEEPPVGRAKLIAGDGPLAAQETRLLEIEVSLPKKLRSNFRYAAVARIGDALLDIALYTTSADETTTTPG